MELAGIEGHIHLRVLFGAPAATGREHAVAAGQVDANRLQREFLLSLRAIRRKGKASARIGRLPSGSTRQIASVRPVLACLTGVRNTIMIAVAVSGNRCDRHPLCSRLAQESSEETQGGASVGASLLHRSARETMAGRR